MMFLQNFSAVAELRGRTLLTHLWGSHENTVMPAVWLQNLSSYGLALPNPKFQENQTGRNPTSWLQSWPDVLHLKIWAARGKGCPPPFLNCSRHPYILRRLALQVIIQSAATRCANCEERRLHYRAGRTQHFTHLAKHGLRADWTASGRQGRSTGTINIYLYSSWLKYWNDALLQTSRTYNHYRLHVGVWVGYQVPALYMYRLLHFIRTPATYSIIFHSSILHVFSPTLLHSPTPSFYQHPLPDVITSAASVLSFRSQLTTLPTSLYP